MLRKCLTICTFHALGLRAADRTRQGRLEARLLDLRCRRQCRANSGSVPGAKPDALQAAQSLISRAKNAGLSPQQALDAAQSTRERERAAGLYAQYQQRLTRSSGRFRRPDPRPGELLENDADRGGGLARTHPATFGRRMPGHQRCAVSSAESAGRNQGNFTCVGDDDQTSTPGAAPIRRTCRSWPSTIRP